MSHCKIYANLCPLLCRIFSNIFYHLANIPFDLDYIRVQLKSTLGVLPV